MSVFHHLCPTRLLRFMVVCVVLAAAHCAQGAEAAAPSTRPAESGLIDIADLRVRDPFVVTDAANRRYILVAKFDRGDAIGWQCFTSTDLQHWQPPVTVYTPMPDFPGDRDFWAPEIHAYRGKYYILGTVSSDRAKRGTRIFVAEQPLGPYRPLSDGAVTPHDWMALDGTLHVDEKEQPWMVFCHEWLEVNDGTMNAVRLSADLSRPIGEPIQLFHASEAPWCRPLKPGKYVTDGPWVYRAASGKLLIFWSSFSKEGYTVGIAASESGTIQGPWKQEARPLYEGGGHCMTFRSLEGKSILLLHSPNKSPHERAKFFEIRENGDELHLAPMAWPQAK